MQIAIFLPNNMKINTNKIFIISLLAIAPIRYIFESSILGYGLITVSLFLLMFNYLNMSKTTIFNKNTVIATLSIFPLSMYLIFVSIMAAIADNIEFQPVIFFFALVLPFIGGSAIKVVELDKKFLIKIITCYILIEFFIILGQMLKYSVGFGLPSPVSYGGSGMVTGSQYNANNLAALLIPISLCVGFLGQELSSRRSLILWVLLFCMQVLLASKASIVLTALIYIATSRLTYQRLFSISTIVLVVVFGFSFLLNYNTTSGILGRISVRMNDMVTLLTFWEKRSGDSVSERTDSYSYFLDNFVDRIGLGSFEFGNYSYFFHDGSRVYELFKANPHSLLIELSYYAGWFGLFFGLIAFIGIFLIYNSGGPKSKLLIILSFVIASFIPSTLIGNFTFLVFFAFAVILSNNSKLKTAKHLNKLGREC